jgi:hypothetical protein
MNISTEIRRIIQHQESIGCGDNGCKHVKPKVGTNAGCNCAMQSTSTILDFILKNEVEFLQQMNDAKDYAKRHPHHDGLM